MATRDNGHASEAVDKSMRNTDSRVTSNAKTNPFRWTLGLLVRLCIWYALLTPFFRCPSRLSDLNESSPRVCKPYLVARSYIDPHVAPYYDAYAAPYVDATRPYVNLLNEKVYTPSVNVAKHGYEKYGAPALNQAQAFSQQQWDAQVTPRLQSVKGRANDLYASEVSPHVQRVKAALSPYYQRVNSAIRSAAQNYILPFYARSRPFIGKTYTSGQDMLATTVLPYAQSTWSSAISFVSSSLWPKVTGLYSENVEPQLVKIGQRLASYRERKRFHSVVDESDSTTTKVDQSTSSTISSVEAVSVEPPSTPSVVAASPTPQKLTPAQIAAQARERIESDLQTWEEKFAVAAGNAVEELEARIVEIIDAYIATQAKDYGEGLLADLQAVVEQETSAVKDRINSLAESLPAEDAPEEEEKAQEALVKEVRDSAFTIRDRAHALREWHNSFDEELQLRVSAAARSTLSVLDSIHNLGFQEIGTRWAWMDGVTYKDWEKYHSLKAAFEDWRTQFFNDRMKHPKLEEAKSIAEDILSIGMDAAESAAKELARLKEVGKWKITAREVSDNFATRSEPPPLPPKPSVADEEDVPGDMEDHEELEAHAEVDDFDAESNEPSAKTNIESENNIMDSDNVSEADDREEANMDIPLDRAAEETESTTSFDDDEAVLEDVGDEPTKPVWGAEAAAVPPVHRVVDNNDDLNGDAEEVEELTQPLKTDEDEETSADSADSRSTQTSSETTDQKESPHASVKELVNKLLADQGSDLPEDVKLKLQALYESPDLMKPTSSVNSEEDVPTSSASPAPVSSIVVEDEKNTGEEAVGSGFEDKPVMKDL
ncbi:hypothetical protein HFD88_009267 [Aspergillus terreus]|nr:hypothetical protein HFD88_009267 [Aspergillus terreus]